ncbi:MAG: aldo/keto reductase [Gammaproteobacteria bacterium]|nr:aldo/keto reductase [Gammaproteobacteria bacterium]
MSEEYRPPRRQLIKAGLAAGALGAGVPLARAASDGVGQSRLAQARPGAAVPRRVLGRTGVSLPILHLGTSQDLDERYDKVMHRCFSMGVDWFDTALSYGWGSSHRAIATFLGQIGDRSKLWLTSKSGAYSPERMIEDAGKALDELQTDYLDLYLMHGIRDAAKLEPEYLRAAERLKREGRIRFFGFSCHDGNVVELLDKAARVGGVDAILLRYNFRRYGDRELNLAMDRCHKAGIGLLAMKTMGSVPADLEKVVEFKSRDFTLGQAKLKSVWADERITSICSEMDNVQRVRENVAAARSEQPLSAQEAHQLNQLAHLTACHACVGCSHLCEAAAGGQVAIADSLRYLSYYECYGKTERARALYRDLPAAARRSSGSALRAAAAVCPQGIDIEARLRQAEVLLG